MASWSWSIRGRKHKNSSYWFIKRSSSAWSRNLCMWCTTESYWELESSTKPALSSSKEYSFSLLSAALVVLNLIMLVLLPTPSSAWWWLSQLGGGVLSLRRFSSSCGWSAAAAAAAASTGGTCIIPWGQVVLALVSLLRTAFTTSCLVDVSG